MYGGGQIRICSLLEYVARKSDVDLVVFSDYGEVEMPRAFRRMYTVHLPRHSRRLLPKLWRNASRYLRRVPPLVDRFSGREAEIGRFLEGQTYDAALLMHFWTAPYEPLVRRHAARVVLDLQNVESDLMAQLGPFGEITRRWEREWLPRFDAVLAPCAEDVAKLPVPAIVYPNAIPAPPETPPAIRRQGLAMSGNFDFTPNREGLRWFQNRVWPRLRQRFPGLRLRLIGRASDRQPLSEGMEATGTVADAYVELARAEAAVIPLFSGSGTRLKILEAWAAATPVVSTTLGAAGLGAVDGKDLLLADDEESFVEAVSFCLTDPARASDRTGHARRTLQDRFTWPRAWAKLEECRVLY